MKRIEMWNPQEVYTLQLSCSPAAASCLANHDFSRRSRNSQIRHHVQNSYNSENYVLLISPSHYVRMHLCKPAACTRAAALQGHCLINSCHCAKSLFIHTERHNAHPGPVTWPVQLQGRERGSTQLVPLDELNVSFRPYFLCQDF